MEPASPTWVNTTYSRNVGPGEGREGQALGGSIPGGLYDRTKGASGYGSYASTARQGRSCALPIPCGARGGVSVPVLSPEFEAVGGLVGSHPGMTIYEERVWEARSTNFSPSACDSGLSQSLPSSFGTSPGPRWGTTSPSAPAWDAPPLVVRAANVPVTNISVNSPDPLEDSFSSPVPHMMKNLQLDDKLSPARQGVVGRYGEGVGGSYGSGGIIVAHSGTPVQGTPPETYGSPMNMYSTAQASPHLQQQGYSESPSLPPAAIVVARKSSAALADSQVGGEWNSPGPEVPWDNLGSPTMYAPSEPPAPSQGADSLLTDEWVTGSVPGKAPFQCTPLTEGHAGVRSSFASDPPLGLDCAGNTGASIGAAAPTLVKQEGLAPQQSCGGGGEVPGSILDDITSIIEQEGGEMGGGTVPQTGPFEEYMTPTNICHPKRLYGQSGGGGSTVVSPQSKGPFECSAQGFAAPSGDYTSSCRELASHPHSMDTPMTQDIGSDAVMFEDSPASALLPLPPTEVTHPMDLGELAPVDMTLKYKGMGLHEDVTGVMDTSGLPEWEPDGAVPSGSRMVLNPATHSAALYGTQTVPDCANPDIPGNVPGNMPLNVYDFNESSPGERGDAGAAQLVSRRKRHASCSSHAQAQARAVHTPRLRRDSDRGHRILHKRHHSQSREDPEPSSEICGEGEMDADGFHEQRKRKTSFSVSGEHGEELTGTNEGGSHVDEPKQPTKSGREGSKASTDDDREPSYFWQYNSHAKGPRGQRFDIQVVSQGYDPHDPAPFIDPVFDPEQRTKVRHVGRQRKGDGTDVTPDPHKLYNIGQELQRLSNQMGEVGGSAGQGVTDTPQLASGKREKNKLASRACRLKKKAQHEADKIKLAGLENERKGLMEVLSAIKEEMKKRQEAGVTAGAPPSGETLTKTLDRLEAVHLKPGCRVAGRMTAYVKEIMDDMESEMGATGGQGYNSSSDEN